MNRRGARLSSAAAVESETEVVASLVSRGAGPVEASLAARGAGAVGAQFSGVAAI